jgi:hypothetical protein
VPARRTYIVKGAPFRHVGPGGELAPEPVLAPRDSAQVAMPTASSRPGLLASAGYPAKALED